MQLDNRQDSEAGSSARKGVTRRQLLTRTAALGLAAPFAGGLLDACSSSSVSSSSGGSSGSSGIVVGLDTDIDTLDPISFRSDAAYEAGIQVYEMPVTNQVQPANGILEGVAGALAPGVACGIRSPRIAQSTSARGARTSRSAAALLLPRRRSSTATSAPWKARGMRRSS